MPLDPTFRARINGYGPRKTLAELASEHAEIPFLTERWLALQAARAAREKKREMTRTEALLATARAVVERLRQGRAPAMPRGSRPVEADAATEAGSAARAPVAGHAPASARSAILIDFEMARRRLRGPKRTTRDDRRR